MKIAIFDYFLVSNNAIGNCHKTLLNGLQEEHEFTVFSVRNDIKNVKGIRHIKVPAITWPLPALFLSFYVMAPIVYLVFRLRQRVRFDIIQNIEGTAPIGTICYSHLCHAWCVKHGDLIWAGEPSRLRKWSRQIDHWLRAKAEQRAFRKAYVIITPSEGLSNDIRTLYPQFASRVRTINNPVQNPADTSASNPRMARSTDDSLQVIFSALGHFERKGLAVLLRGIAATRNTQIHLHVIGGNSNTLSSYKTLAQQLNISTQVHFHGFVTTPLNYYLKADVYAMPTAYEAFPMAVFEAAAAGLPILATNVNGITELIENGQSGWIIQRDETDIAEKLNTCLKQKEQLPIMGARAKSRALQFTPKRYQNAWREIYQQLADQLAL